VSYLSHKGQVKENCNTIEVPVNQLYDNHNKLLLSYNFCPIFPSPDQEHEQYYQILIKMETKTPSQNLHHHHSSHSANLQAQLIFSPFIYLTNICSR
jgi:hypothetical protein